MSPEESFTISPGTIFETSTTYGTPSLITFILFVIICFNFFAALSDVVCCISDIIAEIRTVLIINIKVE